MRNPNYTYEATDQSTNAFTSGWKIRAEDGTVVWGRTKAAARSRLLRVQRRNQRLGITPMPSTEAEGETNDQS